MAPLQWLGTLEPRPSPIVQALNAMQPGVDVLTEWLRQQPDRERLMLQSLSSFVQSLDDQQREMFLSTIPRDRAQALAEMSQRHGIGGFMLSPEGRLQVAMPIEAQQRQQQWRLQQAEELLAPILGAPDEQREAWVRSPEGQEILRRVKALSPTLVLERNGRLEPIQNIDVILQREAVRAETEKTGAEAEHIRADIDRIGATVQSLIAEAERIRTLTPHEAAQLDATTRHLIQQTKNLEAEHPWVGKLAEARVRQVLASATVDEATGEQIRALTPFMVEKLRNEAALVQQQIQEIAAQLDELRETRPLRYRQLELSLQRMEKELEAVDAETRLAWMQAKLYEAQAEDIPKMRALQEKIAEQNYSLGVTDQLIRLFAIEVEREQQERDRELQRWIAENRQRIEERQVAVEEQTAQTYRVQVYGQYAPDALLDVLKEDKSIDEETRKRLERSIKAARFREAFNLASTYVNDLLVAFPLQLNEIWPSGNPLELAIMLAVALSGEDEDDLNEDVILQELEKKPELQPQDNKWGPIGLSLTSWALATAFGVRQLLKTQHGQRLKDWIAERTRQGLGIKPPEPPPPPGQLPAGAAPRGGLPGSTVGGTPALPSPPPATRGRAIPVGTAPAPSVVEIPPGDPVTGAKSVTLPAQLQPGTMPSQIIRLGGFALPISPSVVINPNDPYLQALAQREYQATGQRPTWTESFLLPGEAAALWIADHFTNWLKTVFGGGGRGGNSR